MAEHTYRAGPEAKDNKVAPSAGIGAETYKKPAPGQGDNLMKPKVSPSGIATGGGVTTEVKTDPLLEQKMNLSKDIGGTLESNLINKKDDLTGNQGTGSGKPTGGTTTQTTSSTGILDGAPEKLAPVDYTELQTQLADKQKQDIAKLETDRATGLRNVQNTFSHLYSQGKNNGFMNARNLAGVREANRTFEDLSTNLNNTFFRENLRLSERGLDNESRFIEQANNKWEARVSAEIESLSNQGLYAEANQLAKDAQSLSPNGFFSAYANDDVIQALQDNQDSALAAGWRDTFDMVNSLAVDAADSSPFMRKQKIDQMFAEMKSNPVRANIMIRDHFGTMNDETYVELDLDENDQRIIKEFQNGDRDINDTELQRVFGESFIKDVNREKTIAEASDALDSAEFTKELEESGSGAEVIKDFFSGDMMDDYIDIDIEEDPIFGEQSISRVSLFGKDYPTALSLSSAPGIDAGIYAFDGTMYTPSYTYEDAGDEIMSLGGGEYKQSDLREAYFYNLKRQQNEYGKLDVDGKNAYEGADNMDSFKRKIEDLNRMRAEQGLGQASVQDMKDHLSGKKTITTPEGKETQIDAGSTFVDSDGSQYRKEDFWNTLDEDQTSELEGVLESGEINYMDSDTLKNIVFIAGGKEGTQDLDSNVLQLLRKSGGLSDIDSTSDLKNGVFREEGTPFSAGTIQDTMKGMKYNAGANRYEGYTMYNGMLYQAILTPSHSERNGGDLSDPMIGVKLKPVGFGNTEDVIDMKVRLDGVPVVKDDDVEARASKVASDRAINWFKAQGQTQNATRQMNKQMEALTGGNA